MSEHPLATGPLPLAIETVFTRLGLTLLAEGFIQKLEELKRDPEAAYEPQGDLKTIETWAAFESGDPKVARTVLGSGSARYLVECECVLELASEGPDRAARLALEQATRTALAALADTDPTLGGVVERWMISRTAFEPMGPVGSRILIGWTVRVRSSDPLGQS